MKTIQLTQGKVALVDDADFDAVNEHKWHVDKKDRRFYAARSIKKPDGKWTTQYIHQFLMPGVARVDHRDGNGLNYRRENLRPATNRQNAQGFRRKRAGVSSKFRGVSWKKRDKRWAAEIKVDGKGIYLGYFTVETDAARAYDAAARKYFGEFTQLNFP